MSSCGGDTLVCPRVEVMSSYRRGVLFWGSCPRVLVTSSREGGVLAGKWCPREWDKSWFRGNVLVRRWSHHLEAVSSSGGAVFV